MTTKPLYASIAAALETLKRDRGRNVGLPWETNWHEYLERCEQTLPFRESYGTPPVISTDTIKKDLIVITGVYREVDLSGPYCASFDYKLKVTPDLVRGFTLTVVCRNSRLRELLHETFSAALAREYPPSEFYKRKERSVNVVLHHVEEGACRRELH